MRVACVLGLHLHLESAFVHNNDSGSLNIPLRVGTSHYLFFGIVLVLILHISAAYMEGPWKIGIVNHACMYHSQIWFNYYGHDQNSKLTTLTQLIVIRIKLDHIMCKSHIEISNVLIWSLKNCLQNSKCDACRSVCRHIITWGFSEPNTAFSQPSSSIPTFDSNKISF